MHTSVGMLGDGPVPGSCAQSVKTQPDVARKIQFTAEKGYRICGGELGKVVDAIVAEAKEKELIEATDPIGSEQAVAPVMSGGGRWNGLD